MNIWERSPHQRFTIKVGGPQLAGAQFSGPWEAYGVVIANRTTQHLFLPDINYWAPPGVVGLTMPVPALMQATASFSPPPGIADPPPTNGQIATLDFFAEELMPQPGIATPILTSQAGLQLAAVAGTLSNNNDAVAIPCGGATYIAFSFGSVILAGTNALTFEATLDGTNWLLAPWYGYSNFTQAPSTWQINNTMLAPGGGISLANIAVIVATAGMAQIRVRLVGNVAQAPIAVSVNAAPGAGMPFPVGRQTMGFSVPVTIASDQPNLPENLAQFGGTAVSLGQKLMAASMPVVLPSDQSLFAVDDTGVGVGTPDFVHAARFNLALAANAISTLLAGVAGKTIWVLELNAAVETAANSLVSLESNNGVPYANIHTGVTMFQGHAMRGKGGVAGEGLQFRETSGLPSGAIAGEIIYKQQ